MNESNFTYARGRRINPKRILETAVYEKQVPGKDNPSDYTTVWRVAITLDVQASDKNTVYSDPFATEADAEAFADKIPMG